VVAGLEAGGDEYLTKPVDQAALVARVRSMLRVKALHDQVRELVSRLEAQAVELAEWNRTLEQRVAAQVSELERVGRLRRFLSPQLAEMIVSGGDERMLESHRREITVVFCDLRGFTPFAETAEPEEVMAVLRAYHAAMGELVFRFEGTLERFTGDGLMVFFNDPVPCADPAARAVRMAVAMRERMGDLRTDWRRRGHDLDFGVGIALGYATLGRVGFEGRFDYAAIGTVTNLAARLCAEARGGQILVSPPVYAVTEDLVEAEPLEEMRLKGLSKPVTVWSVLRLRASG
jgi:class 3 adenylate cyclase